MRFQTSSYVENLLGTGCNTRAPKVALTKPQRKTLTKLKKPNYLTWNRPLNTKSQPRDPKNYDFTQNFKLILNFIRKLIMIPCSSRCYKRCWRWWKVGYFDSFDKSRLSGKAWKSWDYHYSTRFIQHCLGRPNQQKWRNYRLFVPSNRTKCGGDRYFVTSYQRWK